jgi:putative DNA primase/helicase
MVKTIKDRKSKTAVPGSYLTDESVISKAMASKQDEKFKLLWNGAVPEDKSHSEADQALCTMLAFWCGGDTAQIWSMTFSAPSAATRSKPSAHHSTSTTSAFTNARSARNIKEEIYNVNLRKNQQCLLGQHEKGNGFSRTARYGA